MIIRIRWKKLGGHVHCRVFTASRRDETFAKCGDLVFSEGEWGEVQQQLRTVEFIEDAP